MKKGQTLIITNQDLRDEMVFASMLFEGKKPDLQGEILAVNPTPEEFAKHDENFRSAFEDGEVDGVEEGVIYYDKGAERAFWILPQYAKTIEGGN